MTKQTVNTIAPADARARCAEVGFPIDALREAVDVWTAGKNSATEFHAASFGGTLGWHEALRTLREEGKPAGLDPKALQGVELTVCSEKQTAVMIAQGDGRTGDTKNLHIKPSTKYARGPGSRSLLRAQGELFPGEAEGASPNSLEIWVLLVHMTLEGETRAELSLPSLISDAGDILDWHERIFLGEFSPNMVLHSDQVPDDLRPTEDITITVRKRSQ